MHTAFYKKIRNTLIGSLMVAGISLTSVNAAETPKDKISEWVKSCPYIGLVTKEVKYGPITLKHLDLENTGERVIFASPGEEIEGTIRYKINTDHMDSLHMHHIIIGIKDQDAQSCIAHSLGLWDKKGKASFKLTAPNKKGVYEIRFDYQEALTCEEAKGKWQDDAPSSRATVGFIIVE